MPYPVRLVCASDPVFLDPGQKGDTIIDNPDEKGNISCSLSHAYGSYAGCLVFPADQTKRDKAVEINPSIVDSKVKC